MKEEEKQPSPKMKYLIFSMGGNVICKIECTEEWENFIERVLKKAFADGGIVEKP